MTFLWIKTVNKALDTVLAGVIILHQILIIGEVNKANYEAMAKKCDGLETVIQPRKWF